MKEDEDSYEIAAVQYPTDLRTDDLELRAKDSGRLALLL